MKQDLRPNWYKPLHCPPSPWKVVRHHRGLRLLLCKNRSVGSFTSHKRWKSCETGPTVFRPYPKWLKCLTICRCHKKGSTFSSVILRPWVLVRPGFEPATSLSTDRGLYNDHWINARFQTSHVWNYNSFIKRENCKSFFFMQCKCGWISITKLTQSPGIVYFFSGNSISRHNLLDKILFS